MLESLRGSVVKAGECLEILKKSGSPAVLGEIIAADADWPYGTKKFRKSDASVKAGLGLAPNDQLLGLIYVGSIPAVLPSLPAPDYREYVAAWNG